MYVIYSWTAKQTHKQENESTELEIYIFFIIVEMCMRTNVLEKELFSV